MPQSFRSLVYLWSAVFSTAAVGAAMLHAFGPVSPRATGPERAAAPAAASIRPVAATASRLAEADGPAEAPPVIDLASPSPAVLAAGITELRKLPLPPAAPAAVPSQPVLASTQPAQAPRPKPPAPVAARRPAPPMEAAFAPPPPSQSYAFAPTGYIGVYTRSPDGMRMFRSYP